MDFPHEKFGLPLAESYGYSQDLALLRSTTAGRWTRQRRTYTHAASLVQVSFRLPTHKAFELVQWLHNNPSWMNMDLLSGNDAISPCPVHQHLVRRTSDIQSNRVALVDQFVVSFEVETSHLVSYPTLESASAGAASVDYPADLPIPVMDGFSASHGTRNVTVYSLTYRMDTQTLKRWTQFAAFKGTAWFKSPMVSPNIPCGKEWLRYISNPSMTLIRPNVFEVTIQAESMPASYSIEGVTPPTEEPPVNPPISGCIYDEPTIHYNEAGHPYECTPVIVVPPVPTNDFLLPASSFIVSIGAQGLAPVSATTKVTFVKTGEVLVQDTISPAWASWYKVAVPDAATKQLWIHIPSGVEYSLEDGTNTWQTSAGIDHELNSVGVSIRFTHTTSVSESVSSPSSAYKFKQKDAQDNREIVGEFNLSFSVNIIVTPVTPPVNPFIANFGTAESRVRTPWHDEALSSVRITNWNNAEHKGALIADNVLTMGDEVTQNVSYWVDPTQVGGAGSYSVVVSNVVGEMQPAAGTYALPFDFSEVQFTLSALGNGPTQGSLKTATADVKIYKNGALVSQGSISLRSESRGIIQ